MIYWAGNLTGINTSWICNGAFLCWRQKGPGIRPDGTSRKLAAVLMSLFCSWRVWVHLCNLFTSHCCGQWFKSFCVESKGDFSPQNWKVHKSCVCSKFRLNSDTPKSWFVFQWIQAFNLPITAKELASGKRGSNENAVKQDGQFLRITSSVHQP